MPQQNDRRQALKYISSSLGTLALGAMTTGQSIAAKDGPLSARKTHFAAKAKRVIMLFMPGAPSHIDMFDYKPRLQKDAGRTGSGNGNKLMASPWKFNQHGDSGLWISSLLPNLGKHADDLCLLRGMHCDLPNHAQAQTIAHTGTAQFVRPSLGAWSLYGLGTENEDLPGFVVLGNRNRNHGSAFLPAIYQGTGVSTGIPASRGGGRRNRQSVDQSAIPNIANKDLDTRTQRAQLDFLQQLNQNKLKRDRQQSQVEGIIESYELAFRMQSTMPALVDLSKESEKTKSMYGIGENDTNSFGTQCLMARRMIESGVRFVEVSHGSWDHHTNLKQNMETECRQIDQPIAALITDLKERGLLDDTLVIWAGEFGRTPHEENGSGRGHNNKGYTTFMVGGGVKGGYSYGMTDEYGYQAVEGRMHTHDWHATILHLLGLDHEQLTYHYAGRDFRLTNVAGKVAKGILA